MAKIYLEDNFSGGLSDGPKIGIEGSFRAGIGLDYRTEPGALTANRQLDKSSGSTVNEKPYWLVDEGTNLWVLGNSGGLFKRVSNGTWSDEKQFTGSSGNGMAVFDDYLYVATDTGLSRYGKLSGSPSWDDDFLKTGNDNIHSWVAAWGQTYTLQTSINEGATHRESFTAAADNITGVFFNIAAKGTDTVTVTLHDSSNVEIATASLATGSITAGPQLFLFDGAPAITNGGSYHFHVTVASGTTTIRTDTNADHEDSLYATLFYYKEEDEDQSNDVLTSTQSVTATYTLPTSISEAATARQSFTPEKSNITGISVFIVEKSTGDVTVTLHDDKNVSVASKSITNANLKQGGLVKFEFASVTSITSDANYHFHVTASGGSTKIASDTASDLEGAEFRTHFQILENHAWHPMIFFPGAQGLAIGNGNFLAIYDGIEYRTTGIGEGSERLKFPKEEKVRALANVGDLLAIGTWKGDSIEDHGQARIYLWDGISGSYSAYKDVPGEINALVTGDDGLLYVFSGGFGSIHVYDGRLTLVKTIPNIGENKTVEIFPGAVTNWRGMVHFGISDGTSTNSIRGVYEYGRKNKNFPYSLNFGYKVSEGVVNNNIQITSVLGLGPDKLYVGWANTSSGDKGVDLVDTSNDILDATYETKIFDADAPHLEKYFKDVKVTTKALVSGQSIVIKYKIDRASSWTTAGTFSTVGAVVKSYSINKRGYEIEFQITLTEAEGAGDEDAPSLLSLSADYDLVRDFRV